MVRIAIHGAAGRMGRRLIALAQEQAALRVVAAIEHDRHTRLGEDAGVLAGVGSLDLPITSAWPEELDVAIDFSTPDGAMTAIAECERRRFALIVGTTGLDDAHHAAIDRAAQSIPVLNAPNMSLGVNLLFRLVGRVAATLGEDYDVEIVEAHHRHKADAPSGTALGLLRALCEATGRDERRDAVFGRHGNEAARRPGEIGVHAVRMGDVVGDHAVSYATAGERIELRHTATTRDVFARGALRAARWLVGREPGRYTMADVLGL